MSATYLATGILIGIVFGVPIGPVGALALRRGVTHGALAGLVSGLGCSAADALYACASIFGFTFVSQFLAEHRIVVGLAGGFTLIALGVCVARQRPAPVHASHKGASLPAFFGSSFALAISSPSTALMFLFAFTVFGVQNIGTPLEGAALVTGITLGTCAWWLLIAWIASALRTRITSTSMPTFNRVCGVFIAAFGVLAAVGSLFS